MIEFLILGGLGWLAYTAYKSSTEKNEEKKPLPGADPSKVETESFEKHLAALTESDSTVDAALRFYNMDPSALDTGGRRELIAATHKGALEAWSGKDPEKLAKIGFFFRLAGPRGDFTEDARKHARDLEAMVRDRVDVLSGQGGVVDRMYALLDSAPFAKTASEIMTEPAVVEAEAEGRSIDIAARAPFYGVFSDKTFKSASFEDGSPVYKDIDLFMAASTTDDKPIKHALPVTARLIRFTKQVSRSGGEAANVYVAEVTSAVPNEAYGERIFVFAPTSVTFDVPEFSGV